MPAKPGSNYKQRRPIKSRHIIKQPKHPTRWTAHLKLANNEFAETAMNSNLHHCPPTNNLHFKQPMQIQPHRHPRSWKSHHESLQMFHPGCRAGSRIHHQRPGRHCGTCPGHEQHFGYLEIETSLGPSARLPYFGLRRTAEQAAQYKHTFSKNIHLPEVRMATHAKKNCAHPIQPGL